MRAVPVLLSAAVAVCGSCSSFGDGATSLPDAGSVDAVTTPDPSDASDASHASDAAAEACGWTPFSDPFERDQAVGAWAIRDAGDGIDVGVSTAPSPRGKSLEVSIAVSSADRSKSFAYAPAPATSRIPRCLSFAFSVFVDAVTGGRAAIASLELTNATSIVVYATETRISVLEQHNVGGSDYYEVTGANVASAAWHDVVLFYDYSTTARSLAVSIDGVSLTVNRSSVALGELREVFVAAGYTPASLAAHYFLDDVVIR